MSGEDFLDIPKDDETHHPTPDMHVRRAFKRLLRMIRLGQLIELSEYSGDNKNDIENELIAIENHINKIKDKLND